MTDQHRLTPSQSPFTEAVPDSARAVLEIDLAAIAANWLDLQAKVAPARCAAVVKADGYGLGLTQVASALASEGCSTFFVATLDEGRHLRTTLSDVDIYVLDGLLPGAFSEFAGQGLRPVLSSLPEISEWAAFCRSQQTPYPAAIQLDTGLCRLGLSPEDVQWLVDEPADLRQITPTLVLSHLATADTPGDAMMKDQLARFRHALRLLPDVEASLANSAAVLGSAGLGEPTAGDARYAFDLARPGIALYGGRSVLGVANPMRPVIRYHARILQVRSVPAGTAIGYGAAYKTTRPSTIATVATGYADGYPRAAVSAITGLGPRADLAGQAAQVVGRVSMDLITVDVTEAPEKAVRGGWVTLIDEQTTVDDLADAACTIGYEVLVRLGRRAHRIYRPAPVDSGPAEGAA